MENEQTLIYTYDAFISYRHGGLDGVVAERLHKELENYTVPIQLQKIGHPQKLSRIFRDKEELPTSPNLDENLKEALRASRYLIVICSKRTQASAWVSAEIEYFQQLGRHNHICALLIEGEPSEAFPSALLHRKQSTILGGVSSIVDEDVEPIAADIRASSTRKSFHMLHSEKLRIIAPILGCAYDDLVNRHRKQVRKKNAIRISAGIAVILVFAIVASTVLTLWGNYSRRQYITNLKSNLNSIDRQFMTAYANYNTMGDDIKSLKDDVVYTPTIADSTDPQLVRTLSLQDLGDLQGSVKRYPYVYIGGNNDHLPYFLDMQGTENQSIEQFYSQMRFLDDKMNTICDELRTNTSSISDAQSAIIYMETEMTSLLGYMIYARWAYSYGLLALKPLDASAYNEDMKELRSNQVLKLDDGVTMQQLAAQQQQINK